MAIKFNSFKEMKFKRYLIYAIGEIFLIVLGILLALYINNRNIDSQYQKRIDNNILRVYDELEKNIDDARFTIKNLQYKDSLIYLFMNDSLSKKDYYENLNLPYLIVQTHPVGIEDAAYQNLLSLNISDNRYKDDLVNQLKELYSLKDGIESLNDKMSNFVYDKSIPLLAKNIDSFGDLTYSSVIKKDALNYLMTSSEYRSYVGQYAIVAIRNLLQETENFYRKAIRSYNEISTQYQLENKFQSRFNKKTLSKFTGLYIDINAVKPKSGDTLMVTLQNDSLFLGNKETRGVHLNPINDNRFFIYREVRGEFVTFFKETEVDSNRYMRVHLLSNRWKFKRKNE